MDRERTLILIPISPMEEHGPHLPIGTDVMAAADIAARTANQLENKAPAHAVVLCPAVPLGCAAITADFPGTVSMRGTTMKNVVVDICRAWVRHNFQYLLFCNHHLDPIHMKAILWAIEEVEADHEVRIAGPICSSRTPRRWIRSGSMYAKPCGPVRPPSSRWGPRMATSAVPINPIRI